MYIAPNGVCHVLKDVPLDDTYEHTLWFDMDNKRSQYDYFISKKKYTFTGLTYTRYGEGIIIVQKPAEQMYDCNYLMFQNTGYGDKWFYAFITRVEYENNTTSTIYFQIDVMQTWHFDYTPKQCFIEREHSVTDVIGENLVPENLEKGDYITLNTSRLSGKTPETFERSVAILVTGIATGLDDDISSLFNPPNYYGNIPVPCYVLSISMQSEQLPRIIQILGELYSADTEGNQIVAMFVYPSEYIPLSQGGRSIFTKLTFDKPPLSKRIDGKTPLNNKLYTYPYCCYTIETPSCAVELKYELTDRSASSNLEIQGQFNVGGTVICIPTNYGGVPKAYDKTVVLNGFPQLAWVNDGYQQYFATHSNRIFESVQRAQRTFNASNIQALTSMATGLKYGKTDTTLLGTGSKIVTGVSNLANNIGEILATQQDSVALPDSLNGSIQGCDTLIASNEADFYRYTKSIRPEFVTIIDDYFTRYGYATHLTKVPNRNSRPHFNFVKTVRATLTGSVPADDMRVICSIYDAGVTFWKNGDEVGNYDVDNRP